MSSEIIMPRLSDSMEEGTILRWLKSVGDEVKRGDELVEIETDKANMTYESSEQGTLIEILAQEGDTLPIGEVIARVGEPGEAKTDGRAAPPKEIKKEDKEIVAAREPEPAPERDGEPVSERDREPTPAPRATGEHPAGPSEDGRMKASPIARRMARELGVELSRLRGSGPGGRIVKADVVAAAGEEKAGGMAAPQARPPETP